VIVFTRTVRSSLWSKVWNDLNTKMCGSPARSRKKIIGQDHPVIYLRAKQTLDHNCFLYIKIHNVSTFLS